METQFNVTRRIETQKDPFIQEILNMHVGLAKRYDPTDFFMKLGGLRGFPRYISIERTDYSHLLLNSEWITSGIFAVSPG